MFLKLLFARGLKVTDFLLRGLDVDDFRIALLCLRAFGIRAERRGIQLLVEAIDLSEILLVLLGASVVLFLGRSLASLIFASADLVSGQSLKARFISITPKRNDLATAAEEWNLTVAGP